MLNNFIYYFFVNNHTLSVFKKLKEFKYILFLYDGYTGRLSSLLHILLNELSF